MINYIDKLNDSNTFLDFIQEELELSKNTFFTGSDLSSLEEWDSLAIMSFVSLLDSRFNISIDTDNLSKCKKPIDLYKLVKKKYRKWFKEKIVQL